MFASLASSDSKMDTTLGVGSWFFCSIGMMVFNKLAVQAFPAECTLVGIQMLFTAIVMAVFFWKTIHFGSFSDVARWSLVAPFFTGMLLTSMLALSHAPMTLLIVIRAFSPIVSLVIERFYPDPLKVSPQMFGSMFLMVFGAAIYVHSMEEHNYAGVGWAVLNIFFAVGDRLLQRLMLAKEQHPVDISKTGITLLNNLEGMVPLFVVGFLKHEFSEVGPILTHLSGLGWLWLFLSCVVGVLISYTGIWAQSLISATTFLVLVNVNKFFVIFIEAVVMRSKVLSSMQIVGAMFTIAGGIAYGQARNRIEEEHAKLLKEDLPEAQSLLNDVDDPEKADSEGADIAGGR